MNSNKNNNRLHINIMADSLEQHFMEEWSKTWLKQIMELTKMSSFSHDYCAIASNPNLTMDVIFSYPKSMWAWTWVSRNPNLTIDILKKHPHKPWNWLEISKHKNITMSMITDNPRFQWNWNGIYYNPNLTIDFVLKHWWKKWDWLWIYKNVDIPMDIIIDNSLNEQIHFHPINNNTMSQYCQNKCVTEDVVEKYITFEWDFDALSRNSNISFEFVLKHLDKPWNFRHFTNRVEMKHIENNIELFKRCSGMFYSNIVQNPNLTVGFIAKYPTYARWMVNDIAINPAFTQKDLELLCIIFNEPFPTGSFCLNPNITEQFVFEQYEKYNRRHFPFSYLNHESITLEFFVKHAHLNLHINEYLVLKRCDETRESTIRHNIQKINLASIYEFHQQPDLYVDCGDVVANVELVFMDCYLMRMIMQK